MVRSKPLAGGDTLLEREPANILEIFTHRKGGDRFVDSYFEQERSTLEQDLKGLVNDRRSYALARFVALMCADEPLELPNTAIRIL